MHAKDIWSEATRYPLLKIVERGRERRDVVLTMRANNRLAGFIGDLRAQVGAAQLGAEHLDDLVAAYGAEAIRSAVDTTIEDTKRRFRDEISGWEDGTYEVIPDRCSPQTYKYGSPRQIWGAEDPRSGHSFFDHGGEVNAGWVNAVREVDGWGALVAANGNLIKASAEINEALFPHILRGRNYRTDSGGAGQWRGGCGSHFVKEVRTPTYVNQYVVNQRHLHPGIAGGHDGAPDRCVISEGTERAQVVAPSVAELRMETGDRLVYDFGGGGGWGDPLDRDPADVLEDVWDEYVSIRAASDEYAVVITGSLEEMTLAIDSDATNALRTERRAQR